MNLLIIKLSHNSIDLIVSSEAKQIVRQAWLRLKKLAGESLKKPVFGWLIKTLASSAVHYLIQHLIK